MYPDGLLHTKKAGYEPYLDNYIKQVIEASICDANAILLGEFSTS